jgi:hypothetical protein
MAVHEPHTWIVSEKCDYKVSFGRQKSSVTAWRVFCVEGDIWIVWTRALSENLKIESVKVDRMRDILFCLDSKVNPDIPFGNANDSIRLGE